MLFTGLSWEAWMGSSGSASLAYPANAGGFSGRSGGRVQPEEPVLVLLMPHRHPHPGGRWGIYCTKDWLCQHLLVLVNKRGFIGNQVTTTVGVKVISHNAIHWVELGSMDGEQRFRQPCLSC